MNATDRADDGHQDKIRERWHLVCGTCHGAVCPDTGRCACDAAMDQAFDDQEAAALAQACEDEGMLDLMFDRLQYEEPGS